MNIQRVCMHLNASVQIPVATRARGRNPLMEPRLSLSLHELPSDPRLVRVSDYPFLLTAHT